MSETVKCPTCGADCIEHKTGYEAVQPKVLQEQAHKDELSIKAMSATIEKLKSDYADLQSMIEEYETTVANKIKILERVAKAAEKANLVCVAMDNVECQVLQTLNDTIKLAKAGGIL